MHFCFRLLKIGPRGSKLLTKNDFKIRFWFSTTDQLVKSSKYFFLAVSTASKICSSTNYSLFLSQFKSSIRVTVTKFSAATPKLSSKVNRRNLLLQLHLHTKIGIVFEQRRWLHIVCSIALPKNHRFHGNRRLFCLLQLFSRVPHPRWLANQSVAWCTSCCALRVRVSARFSENSASYTAQPLEKFPFRRRKGGRRFARENRLCSKSGFSCEFGSVRGV